MASNPSSLSNGASANSGRTLAERVQARVNAVGLALEERPGRSGSVRKSSRPSRKSAAPSLANGSESQKEVRSLQRVYSELKVTYQRYRRQTGQPGVPALKEAVRAFKRGQSLSSLVEVASFLDDRGLLRW